MHFLLSITGREFFQLALSVQEALNKSLVTEIQVRICSRCWDAKINKLPGGAHSLAEKSGKLTERDNKYDIKKVLWEHSNEQDC
jgi:hypothetical protein